MTEKTPDTTEDWAEQCLRQCRAEAACSLRALLQERTPEAPGDNATGGRAPPPEIIITPADLEGSGTEPVCVTPPRPDASHTGGGGKFSPEPKHRGHSLRRLLTRTRKSRHAEKRAPVEGTAAEHAVFSDGRAADGRTAARAAAAAAAAAARRSGQLSDSSATGRFMSMRSPQPLEPETDDLAIRLRAYTESGPGRPSVAAGRRHSATCLSADFQRYLAARVAELRERRRRGLSDEQVRDEFLREVGGMLREMADQIRQERLQRQLQEQYSQPALPSRLVTSAAHRISRGFQAAGGAVRHALQFLIRAGHHEQEAC